MLLLKKLRKDKDLKMLSKPRILVGVKNAVFRWRIVEQVDEKL